MMEAERVVSYILPFLSVVVGYVVVIFFQPKTTAYVRLLLAFSGAFLLALTVFSLLPEVYEYSYEKTIGLCIVAGILLQTVLEFFSKGAEHGHIHFSEDKSYCFPWSLFVSLSVHSVLEGLPMHHHNSLVWGIVVHKLPISIILTFFFLRYNVGRLQTLLYLSIFSLMTPLGAFLSVHFPLLEQYRYQISALAIGIFLHVSSVILFESSQGHKFNIYKLSAIVLGFYIAYLI